MVTPPTPDGFAERDCAGAVAARLMEKDER